MNALCWHVGCRLLHALRQEEDRRVIKNLCIVSLVLLAAIAVGCSTTNQASTDNANANAATSPASQTATTRQGPDNSEISTSVDANGVKTETRTFHNNPRISRVVVTTRNGVKTGKAVSPSGEERDLDQNEVEEALEATGEKVASAAGFVADKTEDAAGEAADKAEDVKDKTVSTAKDVKEKTVSGTKTVAKGTKNVAEKTVSGTKKVVKKVIP